MKARAAVAFATGLVAMLLAGLWLGGHPAQLPGFVRDVFVSEPAGLTAEAVETIEQRYYREVGEDELTNASLQGMVRELRRRYDDRFSEYFSPQGLAAFNEQIEGRFSGIGLSVVPVERGLRAEQVYPGAPAAKAGIRPGDVIVSVGGESIAGLDSAAATAKIKGPEGTEVTIGVRDGRGGGVEQLTLTREEVELPNVSGRIETVEGTKLGYVRMLSFSNGASERLKEEVERLRGKGAEGIVLDLRGNPGGLLGEAVRSASVFLPEGEVVVSTESRSQGRTVHETTGGNLPPMPIAVLIDRGTASAAEILTAALESDGATVVGQRSFGKGVFQEEIDLDNGGALKLTVGEYFTPDDVNLAESKGIRPDVRASDNPETKADEEVQRALRTLAGRVEG